MVDPSSAAKSAQISKKATIFFFLISAKWPRDYTKVLIFTQ